MAKQIIWAREAVADRIQILDYWYDRLGSKEYPIKLDETFRDAVQLLANFPNLGRELQGREERFIIKDHYQIFYLEDDNSVTILHIWDTRRNPENFPL